jgi:hypothetical protein
MKKVKVIIMLAGVISHSLITSCKKDKDDEVQLDAQTRQHNDDSNNYKSETDQADSDINGALENVSGFGRGAGVLSSPLCGCTIDSSQLAQKVLYFNFDGVTPCFSPSRTRSGQIKAELTSGNLWSDAGSVLTLTYIDFKVTRLSDGRSIKFNGVKTLKNINGNNWLGFLLGTSALKYLSRAFNVNVTFNDGSGATWNTAHVTEWSYVPAETKIVFTATGDTSLNGFSNVQGWGTNRYGYSFTSYFNTGLLSNTYCGLWRFNAGEWVHNVNGSVFTLTLGVDQSGNPTPYACAYGYKVTWQHDGKTHSVVLSY